MGKERDIGDYLLDAVNDGLNFLRNFLGKDVIAAVTNTEELASDALNKKVVPLRDYKYKVILETCEIDNGGEKIKGFKIKFIEKAFSSYSEFREYLGKNANFANNFIWSESGEKLNIDSDFSGDTFIIGKKLAEIIINNSRNNHSLSVTSTINHNGEGTISVFEKPEDLKKYKRPLLKDY